MVILVCYVFGIIIFYKKSYTIIKNNNINKSFTQILIINSYKLKNVFKKLIHQILKYIKI